MEKKFLRKSVVFLVLASLLMPVASGYVREPFLSNAAEANEPQVKNVNLNIDGYIAGVNNPRIPENPSDTWQGSYIYFTSMGGSAGLDVPEELPPEDEDLTSVELQEKYGVVNSISCKFRVLDRNTTDFNEKNTMLLEDAKLYNYRDKIFDSLTKYEQIVPIGQEPAQESVGGLYEYSTIRSQIKDYPVLTYEGAYGEWGFVRRWIDEHNAEGSIIVESRNTSHESWGDEVPHLKEKFSYTPLTGDQYFLLDVREATHKEYGFYPSLGVYYRKEQVNGSEEIESDGIGYENIVENDVELPASLGGSYARTRQEFSLISGGAPDAGAYSYWLRSKDLNPEVAWFDEDQVVISDRDDITKERMLFYNVARVNQRGDIQSFLGGINSAHISRACNIDLSRILFVSMASTNKPSGFSVTEDAGSNDSWKLCISDGTNFRAKRSGSGKIKDGKVRISVESLPDDNQTVYNQISAMMTDPSGTVVAYGKISDNVSVSDIDIEIPQGVADGDYTLKVFAENVHNKLRKESDMPDWSDERSGANRTDFGSNMSDIPITIDTHECNFSLKSNDEMHYEECTVCGEKRNMEAHTEDEGEVTLTPTGDTEGIITYKCSVCNRVLRTEPIPMLGYKIIYDANGGSGTMEAGEARKGQAFTLPENKFTPPEGKQFLEWAVGDPNGTKVSPGDAYLFKADTTVYAVWEDETESGNQKNPTSPQNSDDTKNPGGTESPEAGNEDAVRYSSISAKTGDSTPMLVLVSLMLASCCGFAALQEYRRKHRAEF